MPSRVPQLLWLMRVPLLLQRHVGFPPLPAAIAVVAVVVLNASPARLAGFLVCLLLVLM